jgi:hypothetical protein
VPLDYTAVLSAASYLRPKHWVPPGPWEGHAPFAAWLVDALRPDTIVELGTHYGFSLFTFAEAARNLDHDCRIHGVDAWEDDNPAGVHGEPPYEVVTRIASEYPTVTLHRAYFDAATAEFEDGSIDLLHIDGSHGYDDVRADFETYLPKMSPRGVVILHDVYAWRAGFGVYRFWDEVAAQYLSHRFTHSWGLGVLQVGAAPDPKMTAFLDASTAHPQLVNDMYRSLAWHNEIGGVW